MPFSNTLRLLALSAIVPAFAVPVAEVTSTESGFAAGHPLAELRPVQAPSHLQAPIAQQVVPQPSIDLHYSTESGSGTVTIPKLVYPAINAVAASAITNVVCSSGHAHVTFVDEDAFNHAFASWPSAGLFTMITFSDSCGTGTADGQHDFVLVHSVVSHAPQTLSMVVTYQDMQLEQAVQQDALIRIKLGNDIDANTTETALDKRLSSSKKVSFNKYPSNARSPWGPAWNMYSDSKITAYCVGCGADSSLTFTAEVELSILHGVKSASVSVLGSLNAAAVFGLEGKLGVKIPLKEINLFTIGIEGLSIPGICTVGPQFSLGTGGSISVDASGQLEVGAKLHWPKIQGTLDFVHSSCTGITGWTPTVQPIFDAQGSISSTLDLHLTNSLGFGVSIPLIKYNKQLALVDQPGVQVTAGVQGSTSFKNGQFSSGFTGTCKGIAISAFVYNHLYADLLGIKTISLADWKSKAYSHCVALGVAANVVPPLPKGTAVAKAAPKHRR